MEVAGEPNEDVGKNERDRFIIYLCFDLSLITIMYCIIQAYYLAADAERRVFPHMIVENTHCRN